MLMELSFSEGITICWIKAKKPPKKQTQSTVAQTVQLLGEIAVWTERLNEFVMAFTYVAAELNKEQNNNIEKNMFILHMA